MIIFIIVIIIIDIIIDIGFLVVFFWFGLVFSVF